ncbi:MAG: rhomboid family intramembrane serine protease [Candidatus Glassbacteria bacterium]
MNIYAVVPAKSFYLIKHGPLAPAVLPYFTSMFLHAGWWHLLGNMLYLWIFGDNVEDTMGHGRFFIFYLLCGMGSSIAHSVTNSSSTVPALGASGAIAGVLGAYILLFPNSRVVTVVPIFFFLHFIEVPAFLFLGFWFLLQLMSGLASLGVVTVSGGIAWWAHIGGFLFGILLLPFFRRKRSRAQLLYL